MMNTHHIEQDSRANRATQLPIIVRQSVAILFFKLFLLEFTFLVLFLSLLIAMRLIVFRFNIDDVRAVLVIYGMMNVVKAMVTWVAILSWVRHYYELWPGIIVYKEGLLGRHSSSFKLNNISMMDIKQGPLGRMLHYGTIQLQNTFMNEHFYLVDIPHPQKCIVMVKASMQENDDHSMGKFVQ